MKFEKKEVLKMLKITFLLFVITAISTLLVALVNNVTKGPIEEQRAAATAKAMKSVLPATNYEQLENIKELGLSPEVIEVYAAFNENGEPAGYCVKTATIGYKGAIEMITGVDMNGIITGIDIVNMSETAGLGTKTDEKAWRNQFVGKGAEIELVKAQAISENDVVAVTGATISSEAVTNGAKIAVNTVNQIKGATQK